jgi:general stress protein YciG
VEKIGRMNDVDAIFRARMRVLAHRGGAATKQRTDPGYYQMIGRLGGEASVAARKRRIYAEVEYGVCEPATVSTSAPSAQPPESPPPQIKRHLTLADILGEEHLLDLALGPLSSRTSRR